MDSTVPASRWTVAFDRAVAMEIAHTSIGAEHLGGLIALSVAVAVLRLSLAKMRIRGRKRTERKMVLDKIYRRRNGRQDPTRTGEHNRAVCIREHSRECKATRN